MVKIKSIEKTTLIDFPGHIASTIFLGGCNFSCDYCYNKDLVLRPDELENIDQEKIISLLAKRRNFIEGVVITGGEPTLQKNELMQFLPKIRALGLKIKLDTNGYYPDRVSHLIDSGLIDYLAMDVKAPLERYAEITGVNVSIERIIESIKLLKNCSLSYEFRTTVWKNGFTADDFLAIFKLIEGAKNYYIQNMFPFFTIKPKKEYKPMARYEIEPMLQMAKKYVERVSLRGEWL